MATQRKTQKKPPAPPLTTAQNEEENERATLDTLLDEYGASGYMLKISRQKETPPRLWQYLATMELTSELVEDVKAQYGGGNYRGLLYSGVKYVQGKVLRFSIAGRPKLDEEPDSPSDDRMTRLEVALAKLSEPKSGNPLNEGLVLVTGLIAALVPVFKSTGSGGNHQDPAVLLALMQGAEERGERRGREIGRLENGAQGDGMSATVKEYMPSIISLMKDKATRQIAAPPESPAALPAPAATDSPAAQPVNPAPTVPLEPEYAWLAALRPFYGALAQQADDNADPEIIADFALMKFDDELIRIVHESTSRPDFHAIMRRELRAISLRHPEWVDAFVTRIVTGVDPDETPEAADYTPDKKRNAR